MMKIMNRLAVCLTAAVGLLALSGCSQGHASQPTNEIALSLDGISEVIISYDEETVTFFPSDGEELTIKEYMTENQDRYFAKVAQGNGSIKVSEGGKPLFKKGFSRYIEVYFPASYREKLTVTTTNGKIDVSEVELSLSSLRIDSTSGTVRLSNAEAQNIYLSSANGALYADRLTANTVRVDTTRGDFSCEMLSGNITYTTTSGNADIQSAIGSGCYKVNNSGKLNVVYTEVTGDLFFFNKNNSIHVTLPANLEFEFAATTKNGSVTTSFQECISIDGRTASGTVGEHPAVTVKAETNNGNIEVTQ